MKRPKRSKPSAEASATHLDHLEAHEDHDQWLKDLERWRRECAEAVHRFASRMLPDLELGNYRDGLDRHEAAILAHEEIVDRHEQRLRLERTGHQDHSEEAESLHEQLHARHELSRQQHEQLAQSHQAILQALAMFGTEE